MRTDQISPTLPPYMPSSVRKPDQMRTFCRPLYLKKKIICWYFLIRKYTVNGRSYIDILNPTVDEYTCQLLFSNTIVSCPRCLRTNSFILRTKTSLNTVSSNFVTETKHTLANFFLRHSYLISTFLLFYSLNLKTTEEEYAVFFKSRPSEIIVRIEGRKTVNCWSDPSVSHRLWYNSSVLPTQKNPNSYIR